ncbi:MAG: radical SAM protein [Desulfosarcinaceae bacterium]|nr:radical SAM protein [Desulfosarcinaceae bacterium]
MLQAHPKTVLLVGYQDQGNLGLGYLAAVLKASGYDALFIDFKQGPAVLQQTISAKAPILVGLSLIFQHFFHQFAELAQYLRRHGYGGHLTIGGHYSSLRYERVLSDIPELDSAVLFEGEYTLLELVHRLANGNDWQAIQGIAYRTGSEIICNPLRPLIEDLDTLPFPLRPNEPDQTLAQVTVPLAATRGCIHRCAFCSIREFYTRVPGKKVRRRSPQNVVDEMKSLHTQRRARIFLFQDDDFPVAGKGGRAWVNKFIKALKDQNLFGRIIWKISCRVDEIDPKLFARMKTAGLYLVYLGIESGNPNGLKILGKGAGVEDSMRAVSTLKELDLLFGYGFMMFDPGSRFETVRANSAFLRELLADGSAAVNYCKMLPYAGTPIAKDLALTGRLAGTDHLPDYRFEEPELNTCYSYLLRLLDDWVHDRESVSQHINLLWHELAVIKALFPHLEGQRRYEAELRESTYNCNDTILSALELTLSDFENGDRPTLAVSDLAYQATQAIRHLLVRRDRFIHHNQERLMATIQHSA